MSNQTKREDRQETSSATTSPSNRNPSWAERNAASIMGGGMFVLLGLVTLLMYVTNN